MESKEPEYALDRFINNDLHIRVTQFAEDSFVTKQRLNNWKRRNPILMREVPSGLLRELSKRSGQSMLKVYQVLLSYEKEWLAYNRAYFIYKKSLKPSNIADYICLALADKYMFYHEYSEDNETCYEFDRFVVIKHMVDRSEVGYKLTSKEDKSIVVYQKNYIAETPEYMKEFATEVGKYIS